MTFADVARERGIPMRQLYDVRTVAAVLGVPRKTLDGEIRAGRLRYHLPVGRRQGKLIRPEWVDEWIERGTR